MDQSLKEGVILMAASFLLALTLISMSEDWHANMGFFWSLANTMTLYDGYPFGCEEAAKVKFDDPPSWLVQPKQDCSNSFHLVISTKYFILLLIALFIYGLAVAMRIMPRISTVAKQLFGLSEN